jgi:hypothetical protein
MNIIDGYTGKSCKDKIFSENESVLMYEIIRNGGMRSLKWKEQNQISSHRNNNMTYTTDVNSEYITIDSIFSFTNLVETFSKCYEKVREKMYSELWKTIECCPFINITDLLILKQNDTDKHIEHLEEIIKALIDDSKLLQTKINSLESQMSLFKSKIPLAVAVESISNSCEKTVAEEILYELD